MTTPENPEPTAPPPPQYGDYSASAYGSPPAYGDGSYGTTPGTPFATWIYRVGAALLDGIIVSVPAFVIALLAGNRFVYNILAFIGSLAMGYLAGAQGQTPGMRVLGIRLVRDSDGQLLGGGLGIVRGICHLLDAIPCLIGYLWPLWDSKRQTFADKIMGTVVVRT